MELVGEDVIHADTFTADFMIDVKDRTFQVRQWRTGMMPLVGDRLGIDTETHLIENGYSTPPLVLLQVAVGNCVDLVGWSDAEEYLNESLSLNASACVYMFNAGFDLRVLDHPKLKKCLADGRLIDLQCRYCLREIAGKGYYQKPASLATAARLLLGYQMSKDADDRLTFRRDKAITRSQKQYAAIDAAVTLMLGEQREEPTEVLQTWGTVVLDQVSQNGMLVDPDRFRQLRRSLLDKMDLLDDSLQLRGFNTNANAKLTDRWNDILQRSGLAELHYDAPRLAPKTARQILVAVMNATLLHRDDWRDSLRQCLPEIYDKKSSYYGKGQNEVAVQILQDFSPVLHCPGLSECASARPLLMTAVTLLDALRRDVPDNELGLFVGNRYQCNRGWTTPKSAIGPNEFLQQHMQQLETKHSGLEFERTPTGQIQVNKRTQALLSRHGVDDPFLKDYVEYKHIEKLLGSYLQPEFIQGDGRVHPRFTILVRTGRTSCAKPPLQQLPRGDAIREVFVAPDGFILAPIDYSQLELCTLAQHCYKVLGHSRLRELLNADLDVHSWFAGKKNKWITDDNDYNGTEERRQALLVLLSEIKNNHGKVRQAAKAGNFGFPGGMGAERFLVQCHMDGMSDMTFKEAEELRNAWFAAYPEMTEYMQPVSCTAPGGDDKRRYEARTLTGRVRRFCSFNSSCNYPFQGLASDAAKNALWQLYQFGFRIVNFIHDEVILELPESEASDLLRAAETIMVSAAQEIIPDVKIKVDGALMYRWYKGAERIEDINGNVIPWQPKKKESVCTHPVMAPQGPEALPTEPALF